MWSLEGDTHLHLEEKRKRPGEEDGNDLTFEQGQRGEFHLGALVAELGRAVGPPLPGPAHGPAREAVHLLSRRHQEAGGRRGRAGWRQLGGLHGLRLGG